VCRAGEVLAVEASIIRPIISARLHSGKTFVSMKSDTSQSE
jgi:hypothetical protein